MLILQRVHQLVRERRFPFGRRQVGEQVHRLVLRLVKPGELSLEQNQQALLVVEIARHHVQQKKHLVGCAHHRSPGSRCAAALARARSSLARSMTCPRTGPLGGSSRSSATTPSTRFTASSALRAVFPEPLSIRPRPPPAARAARAAPATALAPRRSPGRRARATRRGFRQGL